MKKAVAQIVAISAGLLAIAGVLGLQFGGTFALVGGVATPKNLTDYKFWYIKRDDNGFVTEAAIRFYEGNIVTRDIIDTLTTAHNSVISVTRYERSARLPKEALAHLGTDKFAQEVNGDVAVYNASHFGSIKTDNELRTFLDNELAKDTQRIPIAEQKKKP